MQTLAIIQARMGSTRLPGKVMLDLAGEPMLVRNVNRVGRSRTVRKVVIATTALSTDDAIEHVCLQYGWSCFRGSENDVLDRCYKAAVAYDAEIVVRITSDCPLIEPTVIDQVIQAFLQRQPEIDYVSNTLPERTFPRGLDTEVIRFEALELAWRVDTNPVWRVHVTPYIYHNPGLFHLYSVVNDEDYSHMRWTVDTFEDLEFVRRIYEHFDSDRFSWRDVLLLLEKHPEWLDINQHVQQKTM